MNNVSQCHVLVYLSPCRPSKIFLSSVSTETHVVVFKLNLVSYFAPRNTTFIDPQSPESSKTVEAMIWPYIEYIRASERTGNFYAVAFINTYWSYCVAPFYHCLASLRNIIVSAGPRAVVCVYAPLCDTSAKIPVQGIPSFESSLSFPFLFEACLAGLILNSPLNSDLALTRDAQIILALPLYSVFKVLLLLFHLGILAAYVTRLLLLRMVDLISRLSNSFVSPPSDASLYAVVRTEAQLSALRSYAINASDIKGFKSYSLIFTPQMLFGNLIKDLRQYRKIKNSNSVIVPTISHVISAAIDCVLTALFAFPGFNKSNPQSIPKFEGADLLPRSSLSLHSDFYLALATLFYYKLASKILSPLSRRSLLVVENVGFFACMYANVCRAFGIQFNLLQSTVISPARRLPLFPVADMLMWTKSSVYKSSSIGFCSAGRLSFRGSPFTVYRADPDLPRYFDKLVYFSQPYRPEEELMVVSLLSKACLEVGVNFSISIHPRQSIAEVSANLGEFSNLFYLPEDYVLKTMPIVVTRTSSVALAGIANCLPVFHCCFSKDMIATTSLLDSCVGAGQSYSNLVTDPDSLRETIFCRDSLHSFSLHLQRLVLGF